MEFDSGWLEPLLDLHLYISNSNNFKFWMILYKLKQQQCLECREWIAPVHTGIERITFSMVQNLSQHVFSYY
jgi:hypothetical protein